MKKEFISILQAIGFYRLVSGNLEDDNKYCFKQLMIVVTDNGWTLFYDRLGSNIAIFKNTPLESGDSFCLKPILEILECKDFHGKNIN
jgi:hypothetical protein